MTNLTVAALKAVCDQKEIKYPSKVTKPQLEELIANHKKPAQKGAQFTGEK